MKLPEPVAWINPHKPSELYTDDELDPMWKHWDMKPLYSEEQVLEVRRAALEEAAKVCEEIVPYLNEVRYGNVKRQCAAAIRALIESDDA